MAWTTPTTRTTGTLITASIWNTDLVDNLIYLKGQTDLYSVIRKSADESVTSSTTLQNDDALIIPVSASKRYQFILTCYVYGAASGATMDFKCGWSVPSGTTMAWAPSGTVVSTEATFMGNAAATGHTALYTEASTPAFGLSSTATAHGIQFHGRIRVSSTAGNVNFQWAQNTSNANALTMETDSNIHVWTLA